MRPAPHTPVSSDQLTRREDVLAHLAYAAATIKRASISVGDDSLKCEMGFPDRRSATTTMRLRLGPVPTPKPGTVVEVNYAFGDSCFRYLTAIQSVRSPTCWSIANPLLIDRTERRNAHRVDVSDEPDFALSVEERPGTRRMVALRDLSSSGLSFDLPAGLPWAQPGRTLSAALSIAGGEVLPVELALRNRRVRRGGLSVVLGAEFVRPQPQQPARIAHALTRVRGS